MPQNRICLLDANTAGTGLFVKEGQLKIVSVLNALTPFNTAGTHPSVFGDVAAISGVYFLEAAYWSKSQGSFANQVALGIGQPGCLPTKYAGEEANSYGFRPADGRVDNNGAAVQSGLVVVPERVPIGMYVFLSPSVATLTFAVGGTACTTPIVLPLNKLWLPIFSMSPAAAGDLQWQINFGQYLFDTPLDPTGWNEQSPGLSAFYISLITEAFMSASGDTPANQSYLPRVLNKQSISVRRSVVPWVHRTDPLAKQPLSSAFTPLLFDDSDGMFTPLLFADTRDSKVTIDAIDAPAMAQGSLASAVRMLTASIDTVTKPALNRIQVNLKDALARFDVPLPMRIVWDWFDQSAAGKVVPYGFGVQRNFNPLTLDGEALIFLMGDIPFTNVPLVMDNAAPLDPLSPQYTPASYVGKAGLAIQLLQQPAGKVSCDGTTSPNDSQYSSGNPDLMNGDGNFTTFTAGVPNGWVKAANPPYPANVVAGGSLSQLNFGTGHTTTLVISSQVPYTPGAGVGYYYGYPLLYGTTILLPGRTYRISLNVLAATGDFRENFGLTITAGAADDPRYWISPFRQPIRTPGFYAFQFTMPQNFAAQPFYLNVISKFGGIAPNGTATVTLDDLKCELLGTYNDVTMIGSTLDALCRDICARHNVPVSAYSSADMQALQAIGASLDFPGGYVWGIRKLDQPNTIDLLQEVLDLWCAGPYTDEFDLIRADRFIAPEDGSPIALIDDTVLDLSDPSNFSMTNDPALALTILFGARRNNDPNGDGDIVSDTGLVDAARRQQLSETSQFHVEATVKPANEYAGARGAPRFHTLFDNATQCLAEGNRVNRIFSERLFQGMLLSGKRSLISLKCKYTGITFGAGPTIQPQKVYPYKVVTVSLPKRGIVKPGVVFVTDHAPFARRLNLEVLV
jgi:hypothetical protein